MKPVATLLAQLEQANLVLKKQGRFKNLRIDHLAHDSRKIGANGLFVALKGDKSDGHLFIDKAVKNGAIAIVCEAMPADVRTRYAGIAFIQVSHARTALAELAIAFYDHPSHDLRLFGVTGTNGKTTTAMLVHHVLTTLGEPTGLLGTITYQIGDRRLEATHTTPDALAINHLLHEMKEAGCTACAMEVSSHALSQDRVHGLEFDAALFTNLTRDHLDYHGSFQDYLSTKKRLFDGLAPQATALYNLDDPAGKQIIADTRARTVSYGQSPEARIRIEVLQNRVDGLRLRLDGGERTYRLVGLFNAYNLASAYGAARALGYERNLVLDALALAPPVPGRFEQIRFADSTTVIVDYAHTPDALENVLKTIRVTRNPQAALWCVFGCGGDRDRTKRRMMGTIAERYADHVIVTSDNPRTEDPVAILNEIRRGMDRPAEARWIVDRHEAICEAATRARPGDVVLVAGKGHEPYQVIGTEKIPFDDREHVTTCFAPRGSLDFSTLR